MRIIFSILLTLSIVNLSYCALDIPKTFLLYYEADDDGTMGIFDEDNNRITIKDALESLTEQQKKILEKEASLLEILDYQTNEESFGDAMNALRRVYETANAQESKLYPENAADYEVIRKIHEAEDAQFHNSDDDDITTTACDALADSKTTKPAASIDLPKHEYPQGIRPLSVQPFSDKDLWLLGPVYQQMYKKTWGAKPSLTASTLNQKPKLLSLSHTSEEPPAKKVRV